MHTTGASMLLLTHCIGCSDPTGGMSVASGPAAIGAQETAAQERFVSPALGVALDYPRGWTVSPDQLGATFLSPEGTLIRLARMEGDPPGEDFAERLPNVRCSLSTNAHGIALRVCVDTIARSDSAQFTVTARGGTARHFTLTGPHTRVDVFSAMVASVRRAS
jgi:hypothetical protein